MEVTGYTIGPDNDQLFSVTTANGYTVRMTRQHPVPLADGTVKVASDIELGDELLTADGTSEVTEVVAEAYDGKVWNLMVGKAQRSRTKVDTSEHAFFANGVLVGDAVAQAHYNIVKYNSPEEILKRLPARWKHDFDSAQRHNQNKKE